MVVTRGVLKLRSLMIFNIYAHIVSEIACRHFVLCKVASKTKHFQSHADILVLVSEFLVVVILSEWWLVPTTANHCQPLWAHP